MKKKFISGFLAVCAFAASAQEYWINDDFSSQSAEADYLNTAYTLQGSGNITLTRNQCNFEAIDWAASTVEANDGKSSGSGVGLRIGDTKKGGYAEFTIPTGQGVGTVRLHIRGKGKGTSNDREAVVSINGTALPTLTGLDSDSYAIVSEVLNTTDVVTVRVRANTTDPIILNSIQVTKYTPVSSISNSETENENIVVYPNPAKDVLTVKNIAANVETVEIYNLQGVLVASEKVNGQPEISISVAALTSGVYVLKTGSKITKVQKN